MRRPLLPAALLAAAVLAMPLAGCSSAPTASGPTEPTAAPALTTPTTPTTSTTSTGGGRIRVGGERSIWSARAPGRRRWCCSPGSATPATSGALAQSTPPPVAAGLATTNRVCAYDRSGTIRVLTDSGAISPGPLPGRSEEAPMPRTGADIVVELHGLLEQAQEKGPFVLVGHSLGGLFNLLYARTYPDQVRGLVMVDTTPPALVSLLLPPISRRPCATSSSDPRRCHSGVRPGGLRPRRPARADRRRPRL